MLTVADAAAMNAAAYFDSPQAMPEVTGWSCQEVVLDRASGVTVARWKAQTGHVYLAVRGSASARDVLQNMQLFLGRDPTHRMEFLRAYIENNCQQELENDTLAVGGHSLGGLVALDSAAKWRLPCLIQNAPGWISSRPEDPKLERVLEIRTGRDVVGDWGHAAPRNVVLQDPSTPWWRLSALHAVIRQNESIQAHGLGDWMITDPRFDRSLPEEDVVEAGVKGWPQRIRRAWGRLREQQDWAKLHQALSDEPKPAKRRPRP